MLIRKQIFTGCGINQIRKFFAERMQFIYKWCMINVTSYLIPNIHEVVKYHLGSTDREKFILFKARNAEQI